MFLSEKTLDDLLQTVYRQIFASRSRVKSKRGDNTELFGVLLELRNPRARLSRTETKGTVFSCLGETLWYLSGSKSLAFVKYYLSRYDENSDDNKTVYGAYGPRLFGKGRASDQIQTIIELLKKRPQTRQAVAQIFSATDLLEEHKDIPCTCTLQFTVRSGKLNMFVTMRSNDAFLGLPHDIFAFTLIQELVARSIGVSLGTYRHAIASLHLYDSDRQRAKQFVQEGYQSTVAMPAMPPGDQWHAVARLLEFEKVLRTGGGLADLSLMGLSNYWADLARLLRVFAVRGRPREIQPIKREMRKHVYDEYIHKAMSLKRREALK